MQACITNWKYATHGCTQIARNEVSTVSDDVCTEFAYTRQISITFCRVIFCGLANNGI